MNTNSINKTLRHLAALAILVIMLSGCRPTLKGGIDATNLDPDMHPPRKRVLVTEMVDQKIPDAPQVEIVDDGGEPEDSAGTESSEEVMPVDVMVEPEDTRDHLYIDKSSGPVAVGRGKVYHWVAEGGEVVMPSEEKPVEVAAVAPLEEPEAEEPEVVPVEILEDERPDPGALFRMDEVIALVQKYEAAMKARDIGALKDIFTKDAKLRFTMDVPWQNAVLTESYDIEKFAVIHSRGWGYDMDYDLSVSDISISVSDDGTTAVAESKVTEQMSSQGNQVVSEYSLTFFVEKMGQKLLVTGGQAHGTMESSLVASGPERGQEAEEEAAEEKAKAEAEEKAKAEAEEKAKAEAEEKAKAEAEEKAKAEVEEKAKAEVEEKVQEDPAPRMRKGRRGR